MYCTKDSDNHDLHFLLIHKRLAFPNTLKLIEISNKRSPSMPINENCVQFAKIATCFGVI